MSRQISERTMRKQAIQEAARGIRQGAAALRSDAWWDKDVLDAEINMLARELDNLREEQARWEESQ